MSRTSRTRLATIIGSLALSVAALVVLLVLLGISSLNTALASEPARLPERPLAAGPGDVVINELDADQTSTDSAEFIELYDGGQGNTLLDGLVVVLFNGNGDVSYNAFDLDGYTTDGDGYFVICGNAANVPNCDLDVSPDTNLIQNGADAAALYTGDASDFPNSTAVTNTNLVDAIVYDTDDPDDSGLLDILLNPGQPQVNERGGGSGTTHSNQRCPNGSGGQRNTDTYIQIEPTSGAANDCKPDVTMIKTGPALAMPGSLITYTITYANDGVADAHAVVISDTLPVGVSYVSDDSGLSCPACSLGATGTFTWYVGTVTPTDNLSFALTGWVTGSVPVGSALTNTASITTTDTEITTTNNSGQWVTSISALDLVVDKVGPNYAVIGENVVYTITLNNVGVTTATNTILTDTLPVSTTYVADDSGVAPTEPISGVYVWSFGDVLSNTLHTFNLTVTVDSGVTSGTVLTNTVEASTDTTGDNPANNTAQWETTAYPLVSIHDIQYVTDPVSDDESPYKDQVVWVEGVVVAGTGEIGYSGNNLVIENPAGGPWSGLMVYNGGVFADVFEGDYARLLGKVAEYNGMTEFDISAAPNAQQVTSTGNPLPATEVITTGLFATAVPTTAEAYESVLIEFQNATVTDEDLGYGEWEFDDGSGATRADDFGSPTYVPALGDVYNFIRGIGWYSYGNYKLEPRYDPDIALHETTPAITKDAPALVAPGELFTYTITVENALGFTLNDVVITDAVPANATFAYALDGGVESSGVVSWTVVSLPSESNVTARFAVTATTSITTITNADYAVVASNFVTPTAGAPVGTVVGAEVAIHHIQGAAHLSPLLGQDVQDVHGIVTAKRYNGFYMQDPTPDSDDATSEALFVYTGGTPAVDVGNEVLVDGTVAEFRYKAAHLSMTRIEGPTVVVSSTSNALPAAIVIGTGGRVPPQQVIDDDATGDVETSGTFDPTTDGIDFYESLEAMLAQVNDAVAVGGTSYGVIPVVGDSGANAGLLTPRGGIVIRQDDFNPERILVDDAIVSSEPSVNVGASFTGPITGVIDYNDYDGNFNLLNVEPLPSISGGVVSETTTAPATTQLRVASFNVYNLDPGDSAARFAGLAGQIVDNLQSPDIIGLRSRRPVARPTISATSAQRTSRMVDSRVATSASASSSARIAG
jgi:uncharacterized repeat protein (TIGR01451 family)